VISSERVLSSTNIDLYRQRACTPIKKSASPIKAISEIVG
jgi:hypothetical protein